MDTPAITPSQNLFEALQSEIERVTRKHERWLGYGVQQISTAIMKAEIDAAKQALASMDPTTMISAVQSLRGYNDDDLDPCNYAGGGETFWDRYYNRQVCSPPQNYCRNDVLLDEVGRALSAAEARIEKLKTALRPLAQARCTGPGAFNRADLSDEDFERARAALEGETK